MTSSKTETLKPGLAIRVGITGHRPNKLSHQHEQAVSACLDVVFGAIANSVKGIWAQHSNVFSAAEPELRLVTALAEGADTLAAKAAIGSLFKLDVVLPFPRDVYVEEQGFSEHALSSFNSLVDGPACNALLELAGDRSSAKTTNAAYLAAGRGMIDHSDLIIAV